jgi:hypothetical protein
MTRFQSNVTKKFFGAGIDGAKYITREEAKLYLNQVADLADQERWIWMATRGFLGQNTTWSIDTVIRYLTDIAHDIKLVKIRLMETANPQPEQETSNG